MYKTFQNPARTHTESSLSERELIMAIDGCSRNW